MQVESPEVLLKTDDARVLASETLIYLTSRERNRGKGIFKFLNDSKIPPGTKNYQFKQ
jgi:hypothetical protein